MTNAPFTIDPTLEERVAKLRINPQAIEKITITESSGETLVLQNQIEQSNSMQIISSVTANDGTISATGARQALSVYGSAILANSESIPGRHKTVEMLQRIAQTGVTARSIIERKYDAKPLPLATTELREIAAKFNNRVIVYDEAGILQSVAKVNNAFSWVFKHQQDDVFNFAAFKAAPLFGLQDIIYGNGMGADCSSKPELHAARALGLPGSKMMFTANGVDHSEYRLARKYGAILNIDDMTDISYVQEIGPLPEFVVLRYNPGKRKTGGNHVFGNTEDQKFGIPHEQMIDAIKLLQAGGVKRFGLHMMVVSNERDAQNLIDTSELAFKIVGEIKNKTGEEIEDLDLGGGFGTSYRPEDLELPVDEVSAGVKNNYEHLILGQGLKPIRLAMENGRYLTGQHGIGLFEVLRVQQKYHEFVRLNAAMPVNMRPGMYGAYHHLTVLGKEREPQNKIYRVVGNLCENNDHFAIDRAMPLVERGDIIAMHNCGAHTPGMGFEYNFRLDCTHVLRQVDGSLVVLRREKTPVELMIAQDHSPIFGKYAELVRNETKPEN